MRRCCLPLAALAALAVCCWSSSSWRSLMGLVSKGPVRAPQPTPAPRPEPAWMPCHQKHVQEMQDADVSEQPPQVIFYGDSITESWAGTDLCVPCPRTTGIPAVFARHYAKYNASVMAVGGDQTAHLLWRLRNGEAPKVHKPKVAVLLIGTNDLGAATWGAVGFRQAEEAVVQAVPGVTLRVLQTLHTMKDLMPDTHIIVLGLLPRGGPWRPGGTMFHWPSLYARGFEMVNAHYREFTALDGHLHFLDCGERFIAPGGAEIDAGLMPDALHPSPAGHELLAQCLDPLLTKLVQRGSTVAEE